MWNTKKKILFMLAMSSLLLAESNSNTASNNDYNKLQTEVIENINKGTSNSKAYDKIEEILKTKNKELADLYNQSDYIVKPEYLEWQVFFTGFYENTHRGGSSSKVPLHPGERAKPPQEEPEPERGIVTSIPKALKQANVIYKNSVTVIENLPYTVKISPVMDITFPEVNIGDFTPVAVNLVAPRVPETIDVNITALPSVITAGTPQINKFFVLAPKAPKIQVPTVNDIPTIKTPGTPQVPVVSANEFHPITFNITPPVLTAPPIFNIKLGSFCNYMTPNCDARGTDGGPFSGNPISFGSNGTTYNIGIGSVGTLGGGALTNGNPAIRYSWGTTASFNSTLLKVYFDYGSQTNNPGGTAILNANLSINSINTLTTAQKTAENTAGRAWNTQSFLVGGSRIATIDNVYNATLVNNGVMNLVGPLVVGFEIQTDTNYDTNQGKREVINRNTITDGEEATSTQLNSVLAAGSSVNLNLPAYAGGGVVTVTRSLAGFTGYKVGLILTFENPDSNSANSYVLTNETAGLIDFKGEKSIGIQIYAPGSENVPVKVSNQGTINIGGIESYGLKLSSRANSTGMVFSNSGTINVSGNNGTNNSRSSGMAVIEDSSLTGNSSIRSYTGVVTNSGTINVSGGYGNSGMILKVAAPDNIINSGTINVSGTSNMGMRVDYGAVNTGTTGSPTAQNNNIINITGSGDLGVIASGSGSTTNRATGINGTNGQITVTGVGSAGLFAVNGGRITNNSTGTGKISVAGTGSLGMVIVDNTSTGTNTGVINVTGNNSAGVYNVGTFNMTSGTVTANMPSSVGIYAKQGSTTSISGGTVTVSNGSTALSAENSTIALAGPVINVNNGGLLFFKSGTGALSGTGTANINNGGTAFYITGGNVPTISSLVNSGNLTLNMASGSTLVGWDQPVGTLSLNALTGSLGTPVIANTTINDLSGGTFRYFTINKANVLVDRNVTLNSTGSQYFPRVSFVSSSIQIGNGFTITGTGNSQIGIAQRNYTGSIGAGAIVLANNGTINLSGSDSTGIAGDFATINNTGNITITGNKSTGIFAANGSIVNNTGEIDVNTTGTNNSGVGIYGTNKFDSTTVTYGTGKVNITNAGIIKYGGSNTSSGVGIYADNNNLLADSTVTLNSGSNIDMSASDSGVGVFIDNSILAVNGGTIKAGTTTGIYAIGGSQINASSGTIEIGNGGVGAYLLNSQYNETGAQSAKFVITGDGASLFSIEGSSSFTLSAGNVDNTTAMVFTPYKFILGSVGKVAYTHNTLTDIGSLENVTILGTSGGVILLDVLSELKSAGDNTVGVGISGVKDPAVSYIGGAYEIINNGKITLTGEDSTGIYVKSGAKALNAFTATNLISVGESSVGMYAEGTDSVVQNYGNIVIGKNSVGLYSSAAKGILTEAGAINNGSISAQEITPGVFADNVTGMYISANNEGYLKGGTISFSGDGSTGIFNEGNFKMIGGTITLQSLGGAAIYSQGAGSNTEMVVGMIDVSGGSVALYADGSTINVSGGVFNIGNEGLLMYNYPSTGTGAFGQLNISNTPAAIINNGGMAFYVEGQDLSGISGILNNLVSAGSTGTMFLDMKNGSSLLRWNDPVNTLILSGIPSVGTVNKIDYTTLTASGTDYKEYSINLGDLLIDKNIVLKFLGNAYDGVEMSRSKVTLGAGYTISDSLDGQTAIAQTNYKRTTPSAGDINDIVITNNGTISLSYDQAMGMAVDYGLINNNAAGLVSVSGENSVGILAANGSIVTKSGTINVTGKESAGIYARNYFDGTVNTSAGTLGYGDNSINIVHNGKVEILPTTVLNAESYGIYLDNNGAVPAGMSLLTLGAGSIVIIGDGNSASVNKNIGISLINSTLTDNGSIIETGVSGLGIYADNSILTGTGGVRKLSQDSIGYYFDGVVDSNLQLGSIEINGDNLAVYKIGDTTVPVTDSFNTGNIELTSTDGGTFIVGMIGENRSIVLNNEIDIRKALNNTLKGTVISGKKASMFFDTGFKISSEDDGVIGVASSDQYAGSDWADSLNPNYEVVFSGKMELKADSVGIYAGDGARVLNDTSGEIKIGENSVGIYSTDSVTTNTALNKGRVQLNGSGASGLRADGISSVENTGTIESLQDISGNYYNNTQGIVVINGAEGKNSGVITLKGDSSVGIYNNDGIVEMTGGSILVSGSQNVGIYSKDPASSTLISGGTVEASGTANGSAVSLYAENSTIKIDNGVTIKSSANGVLFYTSFAGNTPTGSFDLVSGTIQAEIGAGGIGFYHKGDSSDLGLQTYLNTVFTGSGTLNVKLTDQSSKLFIIESTGGVTNLSSLNPGALGMLTGTRVSVDPSSAAGFNTFLINKGELNIDQNVDLDNINDAYNNAEFVSSKVTLDPGIIMTGTTDNKYAIAQKNFAGGSRADIILNNNGGTIDLSGDDSLGIAADYGEITNSGVIKISGDNSIAILGANGSRIENTGTIEINSTGVGIYGINLLSGAALYGDKTIEIENDGIITSNNTAGRSYGIYAGNLDTAVPITDSVIFLGSNSVVDMSNSTDGVGIFSKRSTVTLDGEIKVGKDGMGLYAENSEVEITSLILDLKGDSGVGLYITGDETLTVNGNVDVNILGTDTAIFYFNSTSIINGLGENLRIISTTPGASFILGVLQSAQFNFVNTFNNTVELGNSSITGITGEESVIRFGNNVTVNGTGNGQTAIAAYGKTTVPYLAGYTGYEVINEGQINLQNSSTGIYAKNGASVYNSGIINVGDDSTGISVIGNGTKIDNYGNISVGEGSDALYLKDGDSVANYGNLSGTKADIIGIHTNNLTGNIDNYGNITFTGDQSVGIYTNGAGAQTVNNYGTITVGDSTNILNSSTGIYYENLTPGVINSNNIIAGNQSIGIYNTGSTVNQNGLLRLGDNSVGLYFSGGSASFNTASKLELGDNSIGLYATETATVTVNSNNDIKMGDNSFGFALTKGGIFSNTAAAAKVEMDNKSTYVYAAGASNINNSSNILMNGDENNGFVITGGNLVNNGNITGTTGIGNTGVYIENGTVQNNGNMTLGDSLIVLNPDGTVNTTASNYTVGIYGINSNITNSSGSSITVGRNGVGLYSDSKETNVSAQPVVINSGSIKSSLSGAFGIYVINSNAVNNGLIELTGAGSTGVALQDSKITNNGTIIMRGDNSVGIHAIKGSIIDNKGSIQIYGANSTGILTVPGTVVLNSGNIYIDTMVKSTSDEIRTETAASGYVKPIVRTSGLIVVNDNFKLEGLDLIIEPDPSTLKLEKVVGPDSEEHDFIIYAAEKPYLQAGSLTVVDPITIAPAYTKGTAANTYKIENVILATSGQIVLPTGELLMKSSSLTWDITPVKNLKGGYDIYAERKDYNLFTKGLWIEEFGGMLEKNYLTSNGHDEKGEIYDKIDQITNETDFRNNISSLAGDVYANINQREKTIADIFGNSLDLLQNSKNNTKENVKINVIVGAGTVKENTDGVLNYDYETAGVLALREVERTYRHTIGYSLGYAHTSFEFDDGNDSEEWVDTIQIGGHNKFVTGDWILRNDLLGRVSNHNVDRNIDWDVSGRSELNGNFQTYSITSDNYFGRKIVVNKNSNFTPYVGLGIMYVTRPSFEEEGLERLNVDGNDAWSVKPKIGVKLDGVMPLNSKTAWQLKGTLDLAYEYELADLNETEKARLVAVEDGYHDLAKPQDENGTLKTRAAIGVEVEDRYGVFLTGEYSAGNHDQEDYRIGLSLKAVF